jgi:pimeloyl-ACP methyl ester carboxylesterase
VAARSDEFCRVLVPVLSATNSKKTSDEHRDVGRRHPDRLRRVWLWPCCHSYRRHHPAPGNRSSHYRDRPAPGGEGFAAVDYDRRGRGRSGDTAPWSLDREVEDVDALIEATGGSAALYTSSSGAAVALAAVTSGIAVSALALYEPPYFAGSDGREHIATLQRMLDEGQYDRASRYNLTAIIGLSGEAVDQMAEAPWWSGLVGVAPTLVYDRQASHDIETDPDWRARWARVTVPTVVYSGDRTFPWLPEAADAVADALSNAQRRVLVGQDHGPAPEVIVPELVRFLRSVA